MEDDDHVFDQDDSLDYIVYKDVTNEKSNNSNKGCLSFLILIIFSVSSLLGWSLYSLSI